MKIHILIYIVLLFTFTLAQAKDSLKITSPNNNEKYLIGSKVKITWEGIPLQDTVIIMVSSDIGKSWEAITDTATNGEYYWKLLDNNLINKTLLFTVQSKKVEDFDPMKIECRTILKPKYDKLYLNKINCEFVETSDISPDGNEVAIQSYETTFWDSFTGKLRKRWIDSTFIVPKSNYIFTDIRYSPNGKNLMTLSDRLNLYDLQNKKKIKFTNLNGGYWSLSYSPDGEKIAYSRSDSVIVKSTTDLSSLFAVPTHRSSDAYLYPQHSFSPDSKKIIMYTYKTINIYDSETGNILNKINTDRWYLNCVNYSPDGSQILIAGWNSLGYIFNIYSSQNGDLILSINIKDVNNNRNIKTAIFSSDGKYILIGGGKGIEAKGYIYIFNTQTGNLVRELVAHTSPTSVLRISKDGKFLVSASNNHNYGAASYSNPDSTTKVWFVCQKDTSTLVTILKANIISKNVNMGTIETNTQKDSLVSACIFNFSELPVHINDIQLTGTNSNQFEMLTNVPFDIPANGTYPIKFRFKPNSTGFKKADFRIIYQENDTLTQSIWGNATGFDIQSNQIDLGTICNNTKKDTIDAFAIQNNSTMPISVKKVSLIDLNSNYSLLSNTNTFTLNIGQSYNIDLSYLPKQIGKHSATIQFEILEKDTSIFVEISGNSIELNTKIYASNIKFCSGSSVTLSANPKLSNVSYLWSNGAISDEIVVDKSGKYWLYSLLDGKCETRDTIEIFENPNPIVYIIGEDKLCLTKTLVLSSDKDFKSYKWNTGETTKSIVVNQAGIYNLTIIDSNGCSTNTSHTISQFEIKVLLTPNIIEHKEIEIGESSEIKLKIENQNNLLLNVERIYYSSNNKDIVSNQSIGMYEINDVLLPRELKDYQDTINIKINQPCDTTLQVITNGVGIAYSTVYVPNLEAIPNTQDYKIPILKKQCKNYGNITSEFVAKVAINSEFYKPTNTSTTILNKDIISSISGTLTGVTIDTLYTLKGNVYLANDDISPIKITELIPTNPRWKIIKEDGELKLKGICGQDTRKIEINQLFLEISPNPVKDKLILNCKGYDDNELLTIMNIVGANLLETTIKETIDVSSLSSGLYFLKLRNQVYKFVKE